MSKAFFSLSGMVRIACYVLRIAWCVKGSDRNPRTHVTRNTQHVFLAPRLLYPASLGKVR
jgi:hypothetical protein